MNNINPLNAKLNPICHLLALLQAHHILHISRRRVKWTKFAPNKGQWQSTAIKALKLRVPYKNE